MPLDVFYSYVPVYPGLDGDMYRYDLDAETWHKEDSHGVPDPYSVALPQPVPNILPLKAPRWAAGTPPLLALASCELLERDSSVHMIVFGGSCHDPAHPRRDLSNELWLCDLASGR